ncbi:MAG: immunoglobulin domain-containing protein [Verrucomicrobia bacterium]|nr:immunoglobulin domain-containing protein [Verrucomicrobiota bacterium]
MTTLKLFSRSGSLLRKLAAVLSAAVVLNAGLVALHAAQIPKLYNTGVDDAGKILGNNAVDPHYTLTVSPDPGFPGPEARTLNPGFPVGPWLAEGPNSRWIAPRAQQSTGNEPGDYTYRTTFDLTGFDHTKAMITGKWSSDNGGVDILLNDANLGWSNPAQFGAFTDFSITEGFVAGINTLEFIVNNAPPGVNPTGLRVEMFGTVELPAEPPALVEQPKGKSLIVGDSVTFSVLATGTPPLTYKWKFKGADIDGATDTTYTIDAVKLTDAGDYTVLVKNDFGEKLSEPATLAVFEPILGLFNTGVDDTGTILADGTADTHYKIVLNADGDAPFDPLVQDSTVFPIVTGPWVLHLEGDLSRWIGPRAETSGAAGGDYVYQTKFDLTGFDPTTAFLSGNWSTDNEGLDILLNGASTGLKNTAQFGGYTPFSLTSGFLSGGNTLEFKLNNAGAGYTGLRVDGLRGGAKKGSVGDAPRIVSAPQSATVFVGDSHTLKVVADGTPPLKYQWKFNGNDLTGQTADSLTLATIALSDEGEYSVVVSNNAGSASSNPARLTVYEKVTTLFGTGVDPTGAPLPDDTVDPHYQLTASADLDFPGPDALTLLPGFPVGPWIAEGPTSRWIAPTSAQGTGNLPGEYRYRTSFNLDGFDVSTVVILGNWATDNSGLDILLNGSSTGLPGGSFTSYTPFTINSGFVAGNNTLEFVISNAGDTVNPTGLRVDMRAGGRPKVTPTPITIGGKPTLAAGKINLAWTGGKGPFTVQKKAKLTDADWVDVLTTPDRTASVNLEGGQGFLRVVDRVTFTVTLSGAAERPTPVTTAGTGSGTLMLDGNKLTVDITYSGLTGTVSAGHIHGPATAEQATGVLQGLIPALGAAGGTAGTIKGEVNVNSATASHMINGLTYVNIHTSFAGGGEIRGQAVPQP